VKKKSTAPRALLLLVCLRPRRRVVTPGRQGGGKTLAHDSDCEVTVTTVTITVGLGCSGELPREKRFFS
jgi:hypothetical protein